jgi:hypothetical protein
MDSADHENDRHRPALCPLGREGNALVLGDPLGQREYGGRRLRREHAAPLGVHGALRAERGEAINGAIATTAGSRGETPKASNAR